MHLGEDVNKPLLRKRIEPKRNNSLFVEVVDGIATHYNIKKGRALKILKRCCMQFSLAGLQRKRILELLERVNRAFRTAVYFRLQTNRFSAFYSCIKRHKTGATANIQDPFV